ncbi:peptidoglycan-binding protein [Streptomyces sp. JH14]|uniref:peptidoglycan-binding domain-containing protein n=1 Tax=Streptomyces sp. JH14 TaxID=2793630 RepID=UPI0023F9771D|nr:peptidoglycan-binding domain-containing protein [Streptomyces sp. JH14]MDF6042247.1 peptidoglycan-binding protein [Streptomyces sp. JH14]
MTGHICPECGTDSGSAKRPDAGLAAGPGCGCAQRAARRAAERAETAAAEDFDPLRIRPYVTLGDDEAAAGTPAGSDAAMTMPLFLDRAAMAGPPPAPTEGTGASEPRTEAMDAMSATNPLDAVGAVDPVQPRRRRPFAALAVAAAVVAVVGTAAFAGGLFNGDADTDREQTLPGTVVPTATDAPAGPDASASASASRSASASASASSSASASPSTGASSSPSASATASATSSSPAAPSATASAGESAGTPSATSTPKAHGRTLQLGDHGPAVAELQRRLREVWQYWGPDDGIYSDQVERAVSSYQSRKPVEGDPSGVYGPNTRLALEAETTGRGRS